MKDIFIKMGGAFSKADNGFLKNKTLADSSKGAPTYVETDSAAFVSAEMLRDMIKRREDIYIVDVRSHGEFTWGHIAGAMCFPATDIDKTRELPYAGRIVLCCQDGMVSPRTRRVLMDNGSEAIIWCLEGGMNAWKKAGYVLISD